MKKSKNNIIFIAILVVLMVVTVVACKEKETKLPTLNLAINGDIINSTITIDINKIDKKTFSYKDDDTTINTSGWLLSDIYKFNQVSDIMFTATDNMSAIIKSSQLEEVYIYEHNEYGLSIKALRHPRASGVKGLKEITVIDSTFSGNLIKLLTPTTTETLTQGQAKLMFFDKTAENKLNDYTADKYMPKDKTMIIEDIFNKDNLNVYFTDFDINYQAEKTQIKWDNGKLLAKNSSNEFMSVYGVTSGANKSLIDAYTLMKSSIDNNQKVMFILPDGYSYEQYKLWKNELTILGNEDIFSLATSVNPAISPVALASIVTGCSPKETTITTRPIKEPAISDIFSYANDRGKTVKYIEGSGNLILTSVEPIYSMPDMNGSTDKSVFDNAKLALESNPDLTFVHFHGVDEVNHEYSPYSDNAKAKLIETDSYIAKLVENFQGRVIIVPDHGQYAYVDVNGDNKGNHGDFRYEDMYIPFLTYEK